MARQKAPCGTDAAYRRHLRNRETVDEACREAHAAAGRAKRPSSPHSSPNAAPPTPQPPAGAGETDDRQLIIDTLRTAFVNIASSEPTKLAPIAREFRAAVEATQGQAEPPKELTIADQLAEARAARAARAESQGATA